MLNSETLSRQTSGDQVVSKWRDLGHVSTCTPTRYALQGPMYPTQVLDPSLAKVQIPPMANRLAHMRKKAGLSQAELGQLLNSGRSTVTKLERSEIPLSDRWLDRLCPILKCTPADILGDEVPVVGKIGAGGSIVFEDLGNDDTISRPPETNGELVGLEVVGDSMLPKFDPGDLVFISREYDGIDPADIGAICACRLVTGETYLKQVLRGTKPGAWTLRSYNASDMENVELVWATPIRASKPRHARRFG
jgi:transcriptional regulator with XRE-family HTH domain